MNKKAKGNPCRGGDRKRNSTKIFIITGLLLISAALLLTAFNVLRDMRASSASSDALQQMEFGAGSVEYLRVPEKELPSSVLDGVEYVGALEIPSLGLQLPVAAYWDPGFAKSAPCRYTGSPYTGDMIIAGHNYRQHFGKLRKLQMGAEVYFTDLDGNTFTYTAVSVESVDGWDIETMLAGGTAAAKDTWDLTLFTCNFSGQARIAVRCVQQ